jgi:hypothetical protein
MDGRRLDELANVLAAQRSRRGVIGTLAASVGGGMVGVIGRRRRADAQRVSASIEEYQAKLGDIAGAGFISAYDNILRWTLNSGIQSPPELPPTVPMPDISDL